MAKRTSTGSSQRGKSKKKKTDEGGGFAAANKSDLASAKPPPAAESVMEEDALPEYGAKGGIPAEFRSAVPTDMGEYGSSLILDVPAAERAEAVAERVIGRDDRTRITNTEDFPYSAICHLRMRFGSKVYVGTGWAVGPRVLVTAGHNVYDPDIRRWADEVTVTPGRDGSRAPLGQMTISQSGLRTTNGWIKKKKASDYGAIILNQDMDAFFGFKSFESADEMRGLTVSVVGYPGSKDHPDSSLPQTMWGHLRRILNCTHSQLFYDIDTTGGQSGSPVYYLDDDNGVYYGVGVHNYGGSDTNFATRITDDVFDRIKAWKDESES